MKIQQTSIIVDDVEKALAFYTQVLGFVKKLYVPEASVAIVVSPEEPGGTELLLEPNANPIARTHLEALRDALSQEGIPVIVFGVKDVQREYERLKQLDVVFRGEPTQTEGGVQAVFDDTCGNFIQLLQV